MREIALKYRVEDLEALLIALKSWGIELTRMTAAPRSRGLSRRPCVRAVHAAAD